MEQFLQNRKCVVYKIHKLILMYFFIVISLPPLRYNSIIYWTSIILIAVILCYSIALSKIRIDGYLLWTFIVSIAFLSSVLWSKDTDLAVVGTVSFIAVTIPFIYVSKLIKTKTNIYDVLKLFVYSKIIMAIYILNYVEITSLDGVRIGVDVLGAGWNANFIGMNMAISSFILVLLIKETKRNNVKAFYFLVIILFTIITLLTGSKKGLFILIFSIGLFTVLSSKNNKLGDMTIVSLFSMLSFYLVMNIPFLYEVLGSRIESFLANFTGVGIVDKSTSTRMLMIEQGMVYFFQQPILGYGVNNFQHVFGLSTGTFVYSHNNYIELLVGIGIIGTLIYYLGYLYILKKSFRNNDNLLVFSFVTVITILIIDIGLVSYNSNYIQFLICISFSIIRLSQHYNKCNKEDH